MNGEIDLELYTISIIALNNALENSNPDSFKEITGNFKQLYADIINDLNHDEIQYDEYYMFFENGKSVFPQYIETLKEIKNKNNNDSLDSLINIFENLNKIAVAFPSQKDMVE